ncbi:MAG: 3' terminal RNA ribose 2'-O-methyltransferase Hen1 [Myxococcota bacterium]
MLLTITTTHRPATDLGYLLGKHPDRVQSFPLAAGQAHLFYPEAHVDRCTAALLLDLDPLTLVKNARRQGNAGMLRQYVNDRPYVASSFLSVAISQTLRSALGGQCRERPALAETPIPLEASVGPIVARGGERFVHQLFEPLGYQVHTSPIALDPEIPAWGTSRYVEVRLKAGVPLAQLLSHLYVLIPVLDDEKHYWVAEDEVKKLLAHGQAWLAGHPLRDEIARRYLKRQRSLTRQAIAELTAQSGDTTPLEEDPVEVELERPLTLQEQRLQTVVRLFRESGARSVLDLGCGDGKLLRLLKQESCFERIVGVDVSLGSLDRAAKRLRWDRMTPRERTRITLLHGSLLYRDRRWRDFDAAALIEVIEHLEPSRLGSLAQHVFGFATPRFVAMTTPNIEHNVRFPGLPKGRLRHRDHRFEWTRAEFQAWATTVAAKYAYHVRLDGVGTDDPEVGPPTQLALFQKNDP